MRLDRFLRRVVPGYRQFRRSLFWHGGDGYLARVLHLCLGVVSKSSAVARGDHRRYSSFFGAICMAREWAGGAAQLLDLHAEMDQHGDRLHCPTPRHPRAQTAATSPHGEPSLTYRIKNAVDFSRRISLEAVLLRFNRGSVIGRLTGPIQQQPSFRGSSCHCSAAGVQSMTARVCSG